MLSLISHSTQDRNNEQEDQKKKKTHQNTLSYDTSQEMKFKKEVLLKKNNCFREADLNWIDREDIELTVFRSSVSLLLNISMIKN